MEDLLRKFNLTRDDLTPQEQETLQQWSDMLSQKQLKLEDVKKYVNGMIESIEREMTGYESPNALVNLVFSKRRDRHLRARLRNYLLLRDFLTSPEKARSYVEKSLSGLASKNYKS